MAQKSKATSNLIAVVFKTFLLICMVSEACLSGAIGSVAVRAAWLRWSASLGSRPRLAGSLCQVIAAYALRLNYRAGTEGSTVSSLISDRWLMLGLETLIAVLVVAWTTDNRWLPVVSAGRSLMALFTRTAKLDPGAHGARCAWAMAVHHAVGISCQRNSGYRPSRVNIMAQGLSTPNPPLALHTSL